MKLNGKEYELTELRLIRSDAIPVVAGALKDGKIVSALLYADYEEITLQCWFAFREIWESKTERIEAYVGYVSYRGAFTRAEDISEYTFKKYSYYRERDESDKIHEEKGEE